MLTDRTRTFARCAIGLLIAVPFVHWPTVVGPGGFPLTSGLILALGATVLGVIGRRHLAGKIACIVGIALLAMCLTVAPRPGQASPPIEPITIEEAHTYRKDSPMMQLRFPQPIQDAIKLDCGRFCGTEEGFIHFGVSQTRPRFVQKVSGPSLHCLGFGYRLRTTEGVWPSRNGGSFLVIVETNTFTGYQIVVSVEGPLPGATENEGLVKVKWTGPLLRI